MSAIAASSVIWPFEPAPRRVVEDRAADGETLDQRFAGGGGEGRFELVLRRLQPEQHDAAAIRSFFANHVADRAPRGFVRLRLELPPIGLDAEIVEALHDARPPCRSSADRACRR